MFHLFVHKFPSFLLLLLHDFQLFIHCLLSYILCQTSFLSSFLLFASHFHRCHSPFLFSVNWKEKRTVNSWTILSPSPKKCHAF